MKEISTHYPSKVIIDFSQPIALLDRYLSDYMTEEYLDEFIDRFIECMSESQHWRGGLGLYLDHLLETLRRRGICVNSQSLSSIINRLGEDFYKWMCAGHLYDDSGYCRYHYSGRIGRLTVILARI